LINHNDTLFLAWKGDQSFLSVDFSTDGGNTFGNHFRSQENSDAPPALVSHNGDLFISWKGLGNDNLNIARVNLKHRDDKMLIDGIVDKTTLPLSSDTTPALSSHHGHLFLAWKGSGNRELNLSSSVDGGRTFHRTYVSPESSHHPPALLSHNDKLLIAWRSSGDGHLNVAPVDFDGEHDGIQRISGFSTNKTVLSESSSATPALASVRHRLYISWKGSGNDNLNVMVSQNNGTTFTEKHLYQDTSDDRPALASYHDRCVIAWKGSGNEHINVAHGLEM